MRKIKTHAHKRSDSFGGWEPTTEIRTSDWRKIRRVLLAAELLVPTLQLLEHDAVVQNFVDAFDALNRETKGKRK